MLKYFSADSFEKAFAKAKAILKKDSSTGEKQMFDVSIEAGAKGHCNMRVIAKISYEAGSIPIVEEEQSWDNVSKKALEELAKNQKSDNVKIGVIRYYARAIVTEEASIYIVDGIWQYSENDFGSFDEVVKKMVPSYISKIVPRDISKLSKAPNEAPGKVKIEIIPVYSPSDENLWFTWRVLRKEWKHVDQSFFSLEYYHPEGGYHGKDTISDQLLRHAGRLQELAEHGLFEMYNFSSSRLVISIGDFIDIKKEMVILNQIP